MTVNSDGRPALQVNAESYYRRSLHYLNNSQLSRAEEFAKRAIQCRHDNPAYFFLAGEIAHQRGMVDAAVEHYLQALDLAPNQPDYYFSLGNAYFTGGRHGDAITCYLSAISLSPEDHECHNNLANCYDLTARVAEAEDHYARAIQLAPQCTEYRVNFADFLIGLNRHGQALEILQDIVEKDAGHAVARFKSAVCHQEMGAFAAAASLHHQALEIDPALAIAGFHLSGIAGNSEQLVSRCLGSLEAESRPIQRCYWHFALGNLYRHQDRYIESFEHYALGNAIKSAAADFDLTQHTAYITSLIRSFDARYFRRGTNSNSTDSPIFIVGMPRSGSSLVEQILSSHPAIEGIGEHRALRDIVSSLKPGEHGHTPYPECLDTFSGEEFSRLADQYKTLVEPSLKTDRSQTCDKMLGNFLRIGMIAKMFPNARIVHIKRDPMDCCWSSYTQLFERGMGFTYDLSNLGAAYGQYQRLMEHWDQVLPIRICHVQYEDLVHDPETVSRAMIDYCGLAWDDRCLAHTHNPRAVRTASYWQVRQPVYQSSVGKWRNFRAFLRPLEASLGLA